MRKEWESRGHIYEKIGLYTKTLLRHCALEFAPFFGLAFTALLSFLMYREDICQLLDGKHRDITFIFWQSDMFIV